MARRAKIIATGAITRPMSRCPGAVLVLAVLLVASCSRVEEKPPAPVMPVTSAPSVTPLEVARKALDDFRDDVHKKEMRIVWPTVEAKVPDAAEVCLISGYIDYTHTRFTWKNGGARAESVEMSRSWFYNPGGESFEGRRATVKPEDFARAWRAAQMLLGAKAERIKPPPPPEFTENPDGTFTGTGHFSSSFSSSSHAWTFWVRMIAGKDCTYRRAVRGSHSEDDIQDWGELVHRALFRVWDDLLPPEEARPSRNALFLQDPVEDVQPNETSPATLELLKSWAPLLTEEVKSTSARLGATVDEGDRLVLETSIRMLGEAAYEPAAVVLRSVKEKPAGDYWVEKVRAEVGYSLTKIRFANHWDSTAASSEIHGNPHTYNAQSDLDRWLRMRFHRQDPEGYRRLLLGDLAGPVDDGRLKRMAIRELQRYYAGQGLEEMLPLLRGDPFTAVDAAEVILEVRPDDRGAVETLERIAGDPATPIAPEQDWFEPFARSRALKYLISDKAPAACRWTAERVRLQLAKDGEDGRMVMELFEALGVLKAPAEPADKILVWRRVLKGSPNKGVLLACENLIRLNDKESAKEIGRVLAELLGGAAQSDDNTAGAKYPWVTESTVKGLQARLAKTATPSAP